MKRLFLIGLTALVAGAFMFTACEKEQGVNSKNLTKKSEQDTVFIPWGDFVDSIGFEEIYESTDPSILIEGAVNSGNSYVTISLNNDDPDPNPDYLGNGWMRCCTKRYTDADGSAVCIQCWSFNCAMYCTNTCIPFHGDIGVEPIIVDLPE